MRVYVMQGPHGELSVHRSLQGALDAWANSNGYDDYEDFFDDYQDEMEGSEWNWFLDEGGEVTGVILKG
jgi:hypothetical protein